MSRPKSRSLIYYLTVALFYSLVLACLPILVSVSGCAASPALAQGEGALQVQSVKPAGEDVPEARQIVVQFDRPMVPLGRMEREPAEVPVTIEPPVPCEWRWLDPSALSCRLSEDRALAPATRYTLTVAPGISALDGARLDAELRHQFTTQLPAVQSAYFRSWRSPSLPEIYIYLNQRVPLESLLQRAWLVAPATGERYSLLADLPEPERTVGREEQSFVVYPVRELPLDARVLLAIDAGLRSAEGPEPSREAQVALEFYTFAEARFLGIACYQHRGRPVEILASGHGDVGARCDPQSEVNLRFRSPVIKDVLAEHLEVDPGLGIPGEDYDPWEGVYSYSRLNYPRAPGEVYEVPLPGPLRARTRYRLHADRNQILDEFGRPLAADIDFEFTTDDRYPRAVLTHPISVLERNVATHVPLVVTNLDRVDVRYTAVTRDGLEQGERQIEVPAALNAAALNAVALNAVARNVAYPIPLEVREWLGDRSGVVMGSVSPHTNLEIGLPEVNVSTFFTQVTPFQIHAKIGHRNTAVWVTDLQSGEPVAGAEVALFLDPQGGVAADPEILARATTDGSGVALLPGNDQVNPELENDLCLPPCEDHSNLIVRVEHGDEMGVLPIVYDFGVRTEGPNNGWIPSWWRLRNGHLRAWGATAQGLYRLGSTVQYKIWVRDEDDRRLVNPPRVRYRLEVLDPQDKVIHQRDDVELSEFGAFAGELDLPETGAMGWYRFQLSFMPAPGAAASAEPPASRQHQWEPLRVLVTDFTPAPFRATTDLSGERFAPGDEVVVATQARLHSGGPYAGAHSRVVATLVPLPVRTENPKAQGFEFGYPDYDRQTVHQEEGELDSAGDLEIRFALADPGTALARLEVESAVRDDRGKSVSARAQATVFARDRFVGVRQQDWILTSGEEATVLSLVLDDGDGLAEGTRISTSIEYDEVVASRVKGAGNAYLTQYTHTWKPVEACDVVSASDPVGCTFTPERAGRYRMTSSILDTRGRSDQSSVERWATGRGPALWEVPAGHYLPIEPEKSELRVGERARFLIRNPFPGARALFTVERIGVQKSWSKVLEGSTELVELEVLPDHVPGFYFSCVVVSPRVEAPPAERGEGFADVDLGKPAVRMGYVRVPVIDPYKELEVTVASDRPVYRPRERVRLDFVARPRHLDAERASEPIELAVAVLDESVLDLLAGGSATFDPYRGFYRLDALDVGNYNLLTRLIGIQNFEKKGAGAGGDGGGGPELRSRFRFVAYWNPEVSLDAEGRGSVELELPDNLTGFRVLAMATTPSDRMGLGEGSFTVNQPIELRPALPNQVLEGDRFAARFTVMNRTEAKQTLVISGSAAGAAESTGLTELVIEAEPYQRYPFEFPVLALRPGRIDLVVEARSDRERDALKLPLDVSRRALLETAASYGTTTLDQVSETIAFPANLRTDVGSAGDVGSLGVVLSPSVLGGLEGAFSYLRDYPYLCWEQRLTKGVMAAHYGRLRGYLAPGFEWPEHETLPQRTLDDAAAFQAPNGGMTYYVPADEYASPYLSAYTALAFVWLDERGFRVPAGVVEKLHGYLDRMLRDDAFPSFYSRGMGSSVRGVALAALALGGRLEARDLERHRRAMPEMDLFGKAHYLLAAAALGHLEIAAETQSAILAYSDQSGGKFQFTESVDTAYQRILASSLRSNCSILSALVRAAELRGDAPAEQGIGDVPFKLVRTLTQTRGQRDHWENTQENVFCMNALVDYSGVYESAPIDLSIKAQAGGRALGRARFDDPRDPAATLQRPIQADDPGKTLKLVLERSGSGRLYYSTRLTYSPVKLPDEPADAGIELRREYSVERDGQWLLLENPMQLQPGELVRVDLYLSLPAARNFVVVDDPVPGGLEPVNRDLATASRVDAEHGEAPLPELSFWHTRNDWMGYNASLYGFYHRDLGHRAVRFYSEYLTPGNYHLTWVGQVIAEGDFQVLPVKAEEMYDPDVFGRGRPARLVVERTP